MIYEEDIQFIRDSSPDDLLRFNFLSTKQRDYLKTVILYMAISAMHGVQ